MSEAPVLYASIPQCAPLPQGATCAGCGCTDTLVRDHCHEHGWVRGIVCMSCNTCLSVIDRGFTPAVGGERLAALVAVRNRCPGCEPIGVSDLAAGGDRPRELGVREFMVGQARANLTEIVHRVRLLREMVVLVNQARDRRPVAAIVPVELAEAVDKAGGPDKAAEILLRALTG